MNETLELALLPFQLPFMQSAFVVTLMIAVCMFAIRWIFLTGWRLRE